MSRKNQLLDRIQAHFKSVEAEMADSLKNQLRPMIAGLLDMIGKTEDTEKVIGEFVTDFMPMSVEMSRQANDEIFTEEELEKLVAFYDKNPWWLAKSLAFSKRHNENIQNKGSEICSRIMSKYIPEDDETETSCKTKT